MITIALASIAHGGSSFRLVAAHEWGVRMDDTSAPMGPGLAAYVGYAAAAKIARIVPEVGVAYAYNRGIWIPRVGARIQIGWLITPGLYAHASSPIGAPFETPTFGFDAGLSLDLALPYIHVGGFGGIQAFGGASGPDVPDLNFVGGLQLTLAIPVGKKEKKDKWWTGPPPPLAPSPEPQPTPAPVPAPAPAPVAPRPVPL